VKFSSLGQKRIFGFDSSLAEQEESDFFVLLIGLNEIKERNIFHITSGFDAILFTQKPSTEAHNDHQQ